ncbi:WD40 repeat-like protein [Clavulina sp. PMI_390]|nr:WD40 repeat-like protein [Clavulina sp. PMI_390]
MFGPPTHTGSIGTPKPISCVALSRDGRLALGSEDGVVKVFQPPFARADRAIMGLGDEVSCAIFSVGAQQSTGECASLWISFGTRVACFDLSSDTLVMKLDSALKIYAILDSDNVLNEVGEAVSFFMPPRLQLTVHPVKIDISGSTLAFTSDSGAVGVLDIMSGQKQEMRTGHSSVAGSVSIVPDRASEMVTGGYDSKLIHFDYRQGVTLSAYNFESAQAPSSGEANISLSPPFVTSLTISSSGVIAAGSANGQLWVGFGGERVPPTGANSTKKKKKRRYWEGLKDTEASLWTTAAQGPVVAVEFITDDILLSCSLAGHLSCFRLQNNIAAGSPTCEEIWSIDVTQVLKVNSVKVYVPPNEDSWIIVGGLDRAGKGCAEVYKLTRSET